MEIKEYKPKSILSKESKNYIEMVQNDFDFFNVPMDSYQLKCMSNCCNEIYSLAQSKGKELSDFSTSNMKQVLQQVASLRLNPSVTPRECYLITRTQKIGDSYKQVIELGIEGDGYDALLRNFGNDVESVYPPWIVMEGDEFTYPEYVGIQITPPTWSPRGQSQKVLRVVYPIKLTTGIVQYAIAEREEARISLLAGIRNNMMNETFGVLYKEGATKQRTKYQATQQELDIIAAKKEEIMNIAKACLTMEEMIEKEELKPFISSPWKESMEIMIIRKLRNKITRKFPKDMDKIAIQSFNELDETTAQVYSEINGEELTEIFDDDTELKNNQEEILEEV